MQAFLDSLPPLQDAGGSNTTARVSKRGAKPSAAILAEHPWRLDSQPGASGLARRPGRAAASSASHGGAEDEHSAENDLAADAMGIDLWSELAQRRQAAVDAQPEDLPAFAWGVLGGAWTARHKGVCYDAYKGRNTSMAAKAWAKEFFLCPTASFSVRMYGDENAQLLVEAWTMRMNAFFRMASSSKSSAFEYSRAQLDEVSNGVAFEAARQLAIGPARARFEAVATLAPRGAS